MDRRGLRGGGAGRDFRPGGRVEATSGRRRSRVPAITPASGGASPNSASRPSAAIRPCRRLGRVSGRRATKPVGTQTPQIAWIGFPTVRASRTDRRDDTVCADPRRAPGRRIGPGSNRSKCPCHRALAPTQTPELPPLRAMPLPIAGCPRALRSTLPSLCPGNLAAGPCDPGSPRAGRNLLCGRTESQRSQRHERIVADGREETVDGARAPSAAGPAEPGPSLVPLGMRRPPRPWTAPRRGRLAKPPSASVP